MKRLFYIVSVRTCLSAVCWADVLNDIVEFQESRFACPQQAGGTDITNKLC